MRILLTGGAGFIGSAMVRYFIEHTSHTVINLDLLTYAGNLDSLHCVRNSNRYFFEKVNICCFEDITNFFVKYQPDWVIHLAAETHVDRSITNSLAFIQTNIVGTYNLLEVARGYWSTLPPARKDIFRFHHISTDEVYGDLAGTGSLFTEISAYLPSSPYSASKASSDHLVRAWHRTYGMPVLITNCSNNYGPYQFPEKLIPRLILNALAGKELPIYGDGKQIRDWLYVEDHVRAVYKVIKEGKIGDTYNIGGNNEKKNIEVALTICNYLEEIVPEKPPGIRKYTDLITYIRDRPGHDRRYAIDTSKIKKELKWMPYENYDSGMYKTVKWYISNSDWCQRVQNKKQVDTLSYIG